MSAAVLPGQPDVPKMSPEQSLTVAEAIKACTPHTWSLARQLNRSGAIVAVTPNP